MGRPRTTDEKLDCAIEAIAAMGNTNRATEWYAKWMPEYFIVRPYGSCS